MKSDEFKWFIVSKAGTALLITTVVGIWLAGGTVTGLAGTGALFGLMGGMGIWGYGLGRLMEIESRQ